MMYSCDFFLWFVVWKNDYQINRETIFCEKIGKTRAPIGKLHTITVNPTSIPTCLDVNETEKK